MHQHTEKYMNNYTLKVNYILLKNRNNHEKRLMFKKIKSLIPVE